MSRNENLESPIDVGGPFPDISEARWHTSVGEVYPDRQSLGSDMSGIISNMSQFVYQRGGQIFSDLMFGVANKRPKLRQFVLTSSDYCKLYVSVVTFHIRRPVGLVTVDVLGDGSLDYVYVPMSLGTITRTPYLGFSKVFLSKLYRLMTDGQLANRSTLIECISLLVHGIPLPSSSSDLTAVSVFDETFVYLRDCGMTQEDHPIPNSFTRGSTEVDLLALFDVLCIDTILCAISALLLEQKVLVVSSKFPCGFVSHLCECLRTLLYPFDWQHVYIPLIPPISKSDLLDPNLPYWIESATCTDHIHPLRFLEVPAPLFCGLRVKSATTGEISALMRNHFPDLCIVDLDADVFFPASIRVDRSTDPLPGFPRKLGAQIEARLAGLKRGTGDKTRYADWDRLSSQPSVDLDVSLLRRRSSSLTRESGWFGKSVKSKTACEVAREIQIAVMESFVKIFFGYREFLTLDPIIGRTFGGVRSASMSPTASPNRGSFVGSDRNFQSSQFLVAIERIFPNERFIKNFLGTQCWDIFVRTAALHPIANIFDSACTLFCHVQRPEYLKFKGGSTQSLREDFSLQNEQKIVDTLVPCPSNRKPRDHFFIQLENFVRQEAKINSFIISSRGLKVGISGLSLGVADSTSVLTSVLQRDLPRLFLDPNLEASKLWYMSNYPSSEISVSVLLEAIELLKTGAGSSHMIYDVLSELRGEGKKLDLVDEEDQQFDDNQSAKSGTCINETVSLWSSHRGGLRSGVCIDDSKLLGGIPRSCRVQKIPQLATFLLRKWTHFAQQRSSNILFKINGTQFVESVCGSCLRVCGYGLLELLARGGYARIDLSDVVSVPCQFCAAGTVVPRLCQTEEEQVPIQTLGAVVEALTANPHEADKYTHQLTLLTGIIVEVYSASSSGIRQFRGIVSFCDLLADLVKHIHESDEEPLEHSPIALEAIGTPPGDSDEESQQSSPVVRLRIHLDGPKFSPPGAERPRHAAPRRPRRSGQTPPELA